MLTSRKSPAIRSSSACSGSTLNSGTSPAVALLYRTLCSRYLQTFSSTRPLIVSSKPYLISRKFISFWMDSLKACGEDNIFFIVPLPIAALRSIMNSNPSELTSLTVSDSLASLPPFMFAWKWKTQTRFFKASEVNCIESGIKLILSWKRKLLLRGFLEVRNNVCTIRLLLETSKDHLCT